MKKMRNRRGKEKEGSAIPPRLSEFPSRMFYENFQKMA